MPSPNDKRSGNTPRGAARPKTTTRSSRSSQPAPEHTQTPSRRSTRHGKPAFEVVNTPVDDLRTGWVYRTDGAAKQPTAAPPPLALPPIVSRAVPLPPPPAPRPAGWLE